MSEGRTVAVPTAAAKLIAFLAVNGRPMSRSQIAGTVWPTLSEDRATANLRSIVWRLPVDAQGIVTASGTTMTLSDAVDLDLDYARGLVRRVLEDQPIRPDDLASDFAGPARSRSCAVACYPSGTTTGSCSSGSGSVRFTSTAWNDWRDCCSPPAIR